MTSSSTVFWNDVQSSFEWRATVFPLVLDRAPVTTVGSPTEAAGQPLGHRMNPACVNRLIHLQGVLAKNARPPPAILEESASVA